MSLHSLRQSAYYKFQFVIASSLKFEVISSLRQNQLKAVFNFFCHSKIQLSVLSIFHTDQLPEYLVDTDITTFLHRFWFKNKRTVVHSTKLQTENPHSIIFFSIYSDDFAYVGLRLKLTVGGGLKCHSHSLFESRWTFNSSLRSLNLFQIFQINHCLCVCICIASFLLHENRM